MAKNPVKQPVLNRHTWAEEERINQIIEYHTKYMDITMHGVVWILALGGLAGIALAIHSLWLYGIR